MLPSAPSAVSLAVTMVALTPAVEVPVPPLAMGRIPDTLVVRLAKVVDVVPVPPFAIGNVPLTCVVRLTPLSVPPRVKLPAVVTVPVSVMPLTVPVPPTDVTVPTNASLLVIVKLGYVPVTTVVPAPVSTTVKSGRLLVTVIVPAPLVTVMPVPAVRVLSE